MIDGRSIGSFGAPRSKCTSSATCATSQTINCAPSQSVSRSRGFQGGQKLRAMPADRETLTPLAAALTGHAGAGEGLHDYPQVSAAAAMHAAVLGRPPPLPPPLFTVPAATPPALLLQSTQSHLLLHPHIQQHCADTLTSAAQRPASPARLPGPSGVHSGGGGTAQHV